MASVLIKAYVSQPLGSSGVYLFDFDPQQGGIEELKTQISSLVNELPVELAWLDEEGDPIRLATDGQLKFAVAHGVKDRILRVSVRVFWSGRTSAAEGRSRRTVPTVLPEPTIEEVVDEADTSRHVGAASNATVARHGASAVKGDGPVASAFARMDSGSSSRATEQEPEEHAEPVAVALPPAAHAERDAVQDRPLPPIPANAGNSQRRETQCFGYVQSVGPDGAGRRRELSEEEVAYLLSQSRMFGFGHWPSVFRGSPAFGRPMLDDYRSTHSPFQLL